MLSPATEKYADWCEEIAHNYVNEANGLEEYGSNAAAMERVAIANKLYAEARLVRSGEIILDEFATFQFLYRKTKN